MTSAQMKQIAPRIWWANQKRFVQPGLHIYIFGRHWWVIRLRRKYIRFFRYLLTMHKGADND